jgi:transposase
LTFLQDAAMERLEAKRINGHTYYYFSKWARVQGKCRRVWQKYLGKLDDIVQALDSGGPAPSYAEVFSWGLPQALWQESCLLDLVNLMDRHCCKRDQGLSTGQYLAIAAINRAIQPRSKRSMWNWFASTVLLRHLPEATATALTSQRFWDHMGRISADTAAAIWKDLLPDVLRRENIDLSRISYDGTNFYTFIDTFNTRCAIARRGKNKQGRCNLRQISYALFCCADGQLPLFYDVYEGNRNDARQFPLLLERFRDFFRDLSGQTQVQPETTLIFDKGNNSKENFQLLDTLKLSYVGSVKLDEHKDLAAVSNHDARFQTSPAHPEGTKSFRVKKQVYGRERLLVVTYNHNLFQAQWLTVQNDLRQAVERLGRLRARLEDRRNGLIQGGRPPSVASLIKQSQTICRRQHLKKLIVCRVEEDPSGVPRLEYSIDSDAQHQLCETYLGKNVLITDRESWGDARIIVAYRSQFLIEGVFREMKDHDTGNWWPLFHWTDAKIRVHALYCSLALLLRGLACRRVQQAGVKISMKRFMAELGAIREVVSIYPRRRNQKVHHQQTTLTKTNEIQDQLVSILGLQGPENAVLG